MLPAAWEIVTDPPASESDTGSLPLLLVVPQVAPSVTAVSIREMSKMLTGGVGLKAEYVTVPVAVEATLIAGFDGQAKTSVDPLEVGGGGEQVVDSFWRGGV